MATIDECFNYNSNFDDESVFKCIAQNNFTLLKNVIKMYPESIECLDDYSNTPLLYACYRGSSRIAGYLLARGADYMRINIFGQNALNLAIYSGDYTTFNVLLCAGQLTEFNSIGILSPLCVATLQQKFEMAKHILSLEAPTANQFECSSRSMHGVCPLQLAQLVNDANMIELLKPKHQMHLFGAPSFN